MSVSKCESPIRPLVASGLFLGCWFKIECSHRADVRLKLITVSIFVQFEVSEGGNSSDNRGRAVNEEFETGSKHGGQPDMAAEKPKTVDMSQQPESCSVCLDVVQEGGERSVARLKCGHHFHLDCIGSAFNAKGAMQCPNCRHVEDGQWLYANGNRWSDDIFNEEVSFIGDDHDYFQSYIPEFTGGHAHDRDETWSTLHSIWCPYPPQSAGRDHPPYLSSLGDSEGTNPFSPVLLDSILNIEDSDNGLHGRPFCPHTGHRHPRQIPEDSQTRPAAHGPDSLVSSMSDGATVTERWSSTERGLYGWGRRSGIGQGGTSSSGAFVDMQHNSPATPMPDLDPHSGRMDTSDHLHHQAHMAAWSSLVSERQVGFLPYHLWEVYESVRLRRGRGHESTRSPGSGSSSYARVLSSILGSNNPHSHERPLDAGSSPTISHGSESILHSNSSSTHGNSSSPGHVTSPANGRASWSYSGPRSERCDTQDFHSRGNSHPEFYVARQPGPSHSQPETSASSSTAAGGIASSSSTDDIYSGIRRVRASLVNTRQTPARAMFPPADQNRRMNSPCPWLNSAAVSQEPPPVAGMEAQAPPWRRDPNSTALLNFSDSLQAEWRAVMRSVPNGNSHAATETSLQSSNFHRSIGPQTTLSPEGQGGSPQTFRGDASRVPQVGRWGVLHSSNPHNPLTLAEVGPGTHVFRQNQMR